MDALLALRGARTMRLADGREVTCRPVFERLTVLAADYEPATVARITGAAADKVVAAARLLAEHRPVSHSFHNGLVQHTNATQASRAIEILYALLGDFDRPGGNVPGPAPKVEDVSARSALGQAMELRRLGRAERPIGPPATPGTVTAYDLYRAILDGEPYPVRAPVRCRHHLRPRDAARPWRRVLGRRPGGGLSPSAGAQRGEPRDAGGDAARDLGPARAAPLPEVRRARRDQGRASRVRDADEEGRDLCAHVRGARPARAARVRRARTEPAEPAGPGRALSAGADQRQASAVHAQPTPSPAEPQEDRAEPDRRDPSRDGRGVRDQGRPVDRRGDAERSRPRPGADQRRHSAWGGLLLARLVGGVPRAGPARLRSF